MTKTDLVEDYFKSDEIAANYERSTGGVTKAITERILSLYLESNSLDGKVALDNTCGTGVVAKELLSRSKDIKIEAADMSEAMVNSLKRFLSTGDRRGQVSAKVMDAQVLSSVT
jgi:ubiquinone/menaquinone biosynthesis C-methylase UbiE